MVFRCLLKCQEDQQQRRKILTKKKYGFLRIEYLWISRFTMLSQRHGQEGKEGEFWWSREQTHRVWNGRKCERRMNKDNSSKSNGTLSNVVYTWIEWELLMLALHLHHAIAANTWNEVIIIIICTQNTVIMKNVKQTKAIISHKHILTTSPFHTVRPETCTNERQKKIVDEHEKMLFLITTVWRLSSMCTESAHRRQTATVKIFPFINSQDDCHVLLARSVDCGVCSCRRCAVCLCTHHYIYLF